MLRQTQIHHSAMLEAAKAKKAKCKHENTRPINSHKAQCQDCGTMIAVKQEQKDELHRRNKSK